MSARDAARTAQTAKNFIVPILVGLLGLMFLLTYCGTTKTSTAPDPSASVIPTSTARATDGLTTVAYADLPPEGRTTLALIAKGGPYPYPRNDDVVFSNREGVLPREPKGYYREYTVITPGASTRGVKRIIKGKDGTLYYTNDHYQSFRRIVR